MPTYQKAQSEFMKRVKAYNQGLPTLAQEAARLRGEKLKAQEKAQDHTCKACGEQYFWVPNDDDNSLPGRVLCGCNRPMPPDEDYQRRYRASLLKSAHRFSDILPRPARKLALEYCRDMLDTGAGWLCLYGDVGGGKSFLASTTANEFLLSGKTALFTEFGELLDTMRAAYSEDAPESAGAIYERAVTADLLVIDELDQFKPTAWAVERLQRLYHTRYNERGNRATIWLTNNEPDKKYTAPGSGLEWLRPLYSRISESPVVWMNDGDVRPVLGKAKG